MPRYGRPDRVYVENEWYDGPRAGVADINGRPHRFKSLFDEEDGEYLGTFVVWPLASNIVEREVEQWCIFVEWNRLYEAGKATVESHPGHGAVSERWDELEVLLKESRSNVPEDARRARAEISHLEREAQYASSGPSYALAWCLL